MTLVENINLKESVVEAVQKFLPRKASITDYALRREDTEVILTSFHSVLDEPGDLRFSPEMNLPICSANEWYEIFTSMLKVQFVRESECAHHQAM